MILKDYLYDFFNLLYPKVCPSCGLNLFRNEKVICTRCLYHLPKTNYENIQENPVAALFWGRSQIEFATALYYFNKGSIFQKLIHKLKYEGYKEIGYELGLQLGTRLYNSPFNRVDVIIPVPLHPDRLKQRGYNQSEWIAMGIGHSLKKEVESRSLIRNKPTQTQTKKSRFDRWMNVESIFSISREENIANKHVLLVDDVITTGATIEACANAVLSTGNTRVSVVSLAVA